jgi:DeoR family fructose operon transcriptional repressor
MSEDNIEEKIAKNIEQKKRIARYAAEQIQPGDFVYLDAGTTTLLMIDYLEPGDVTYVTNGIRHAKELARRGFKAYILGGELKTVTEAVVGLAAAQNLMTYNFSKAFLGTNGISTKFGYSTPDTDEAFLKSAAIDRSFVSYVVADSSKFGKVSTVSFGTLNSSAIITEYLPDPRYLEQTVIKVVGE